MAASSIGRAEVQRDAVGEAMISVSQAAPRGGRRVRTGKQDTGCHSSIHNVSTGVYFARQIGE